MDEVHLWRWQWIRGLTAASHSGLGHWPALARQPEMVLESALATLWVLVIFVEIVIVRLDELGSHVHKVDQKEAQQGHSCCDGSQLLYWKLVPFPD